MSSPNRFLVDSNVLDAIIDDGALPLVRRLHERGALELLVTHVQEDELAAVPAPRRALLAAVPRTLIPTHGLILDVSRLDQARLGSEGVIEALRAARRGGTPDALIGATAEGEGLALVTDDRRLRTRVRAELSVPVFDWAALRAALVRLDEEARA